MTLPDDALARLEALIPVMQTMGPPAGVWRQAAEDLRLLIAEVRNADGHGCSDDQIAAALNRLWKRGSFVAMFR